MIQCVADIFKKREGRSRPLGQKRIVRNELGTDMWGFLYSPVAWTLIILILSSLGIYRELF